MAPITDKMRENRSRWFSRVMRGGDLEAMIMAMEIEVKRREGEYRTGARGLQEVQPNGAVSLV